MLSTILRDALNRGGKLVLPIAEPGLLTQLAAEFKCSRCGRCCDGSLFNRTAINPADGERLWNEGIAPPVFVDMAKVWLRQPCPYWKALNGTSMCSVYDKRPEACSQFPFSNQNSQVAIDARCRAGRQLYLRCCQVLAEVLGEIRTQVNIK